MTDRLTRIENILVEKALRRIERDVAFSEFDWDPILARRQEQLSAGTPLKELDPIKASRETHPMAYKLGIRDLFGVRVEWAEEMVHELKCWPEPFRAITEGRKHHEVRDCTDRLFEVGDTLILMEWSPRTQQFTGMTCSVRVTYITPGGAFGLPANLCVMSVERPPR